MTIGCLVNVRRDVWNCNVSIENMTKIFFILDINIGGKTFKEKKFWFYIVL